MGRELAYGTSLRNEPDRRWPDPPSQPKGSSYRTPAQRDRDRILYSSAFQRLAYVTQVTAPEAGHTFHNRLGHSLKVAQVGRRNAERLRKLAETGKMESAAAQLALALDPDSVEAACLAHDLGHPPFGHIAEKALHEEAQAVLGGDFDAFEGNAQSFRIVTRLAVRDDLPGLSVTRQTLDGLLKYPWGYSSSKGTKANHKWGFYVAGGSDQEAFEFARPAAAALGGKRCLEAEIMDWADDLTYAVHDLDDFFRAGLIPLHRLGDQDSPEFEALEASLEEAKRAERDSFPSHSVGSLMEATLSALGAEGPATEYVHNAQNRADMRSFGSKLITRFLEAFTLVDGGATGVELSIDDSARCEVEALKLLVRVFVIRRPGLAVVQQGQDRVIRSLFKRYFEASGDGVEGDHRLFPPTAKERLSNCNGSPEERARVVIDLISGLTEEGAVKLHQRLEGGWPSVRALDATANVG